MSGEAVTSPALSDQVSAYAVQAKAVLLSGWDAVATAWMNTPVLMQGFILGLLAVVVFRFIVNRRRVRRLTKAASHYQQLAEGRSRRNLITEDRFLAGGRRTQGSANNG